MTVDETIINERQDEPLILSNYFDGTLLVALDKTLRGNASNLLARVNRLMRQFGQNRRVARGFAPSTETGQEVVMEGAIIIDVNIYTRSRHQTAEAVDLADPDGDLDQWLLDNQKLLESCGLWIEHPATTRGHCHLQSVPPKGGSRRRVFYP